MVKMTTLSLLIKSIIIQLPNPDMNIQTLFILSWFIKEEHGRHALTNVAKIIVDKTVEYSKSY